MRRSNDEGSTTRSLDDYILSKSYFRARISPMYGRSPTREGQARATRSRNRSQRAPPRAASPISNFGRSPRDTSTGLSHPRDCTTCASLRAAASSISSSCLPVSVRTSGGSGPTAPPGPGSTVRYICAELADLGGEHHDTIAVVAHEYLGVDPVHLEGSVRALDRHLERRDARRVCGDSSRTAGPTSDSETAFAAADGDDQIVSAGKRHPMRAR